VKEQKKYNIEVGETAAKRLFSVSLVFSFSCTILLLSSLRGFWFNFLSYFSLLSHIFNVYLPTLIY